LLQWLKISHIMNVQVNKHFGLSIIDVVVLWIVLK
jgi:hypothetical protein